MKIAGLRFWLAEFPATVVAMGLSVCAVCERGLELAQLVVIGRKGLLQVWFSSRCCSDSVTCEKIFLNSQLIGLIVFFSTKNAIALFIHPIMHLDS